MVVLFQETARRQKPQGGVFGAALLPVEEPRRSEGKAHAPDDGFRRHHDPVLRHRNRGRAETLSHIHVSTRGRTRGFVTVKVGLI